MDGASHGGQIRRLVHGTLLAKLERCESGACYHVLEWKRSENVMSVIAFGHHPFSFFPRKPHKINDKQDWRFLAIPNLKITHSHGCPLPNPPRLPSPRPLHPAPALRFIHSPIPALPPRAPAPPRSHANSLSGEYYQPSADADLAGAAGQRHGGPQSLLAGIESAPGG